MLFLFFFTDKTGTPNIPTELVGVNIKDPVVKYKCM